MFYFLNFNSETLDLLNTSELCSIGSMLVIKIGDFLCQKTDLPKKRKKLRNQINLLKNALKLENTLQVRDEYVIVDSHELNLNKLEPNDKSYVAAIFMFLLKKLILSLQKRLKQPTIVKRQYEEQYLNDQYVYLNYLLNHFGKCNLSIDNVTINFSCQEGINLSRGITSFLPPPTD